MPSAAELLAQGRTTTIGAGAGDDSLGNSQLLLPALRQLPGRRRTPPAAAGFLDGSIYLTKIPAEVTRVDAQAELDGFFKEAPISGLEPSSVYDLNTAVIARAAPAQQKAWGETYTYTVTAKADYSQYVSFWDMKQQFYIHKVGADWYILGEGRQPLPSPGRRRRPWPWRPSRPRRQRMRTPERPSRMRSRPAWAPC